MLAHCGPVEVGLIQKTHRWPVLGLAAGQLRQEHPSVETDHAHPSRAAGVSVNTRHAFVGARDFKADSLDADA